MGPLDNQLNWVMKFRFYSVVITFALVVSAGTALATPTAAAIENWAYTFPDAAFELWSWSKEYPATARTLSVWDGANHERSKVLVTWAITHPGKSIDVFVENHPDWTDLEEMIKHHRSAAKTLLAWCRHYPGAAKALLKPSRKTRTTENRPPR